MLPPDATITEKEIWNFLLNKNAHPNTTRIYSQLSDKTDIIIVMWCYELGYSQKDLTTVLQCSRFTLSKRMKRIKEKLEQWGVSQHYLMRNSKL